MKKMKTSLLAGLLSLCLLLSACDVTVTMVEPSQPQSQTTQTTTKPAVETSTEEKAFSLADIPEYSGDAYIEINDNQPYSDLLYLPTESFEYYGELDELGRCTVAYASVGVDLMPTEERGSIGSVKPTGWQTAKYDNVDGKYLYNRCHLIGFQLTGENANKSNLITGTRYLNIQGMLDFENMVADYVKETENHVLYRVTPIFEGDNLLASGVLMEGWSVEDDGEGICFNIYAYNVQPGILLDYATGDSQLADGSASEESEAMTYILNTKSKKFHLPSCGSVETIKSDYKKEAFTSREQLISGGYSACGNCKP